MRNKDGNSATFVSNNRHKYTSSCGNYYYHLAIIDYLQEFNFDKWSESKFKTWILRRNAHLISAVEPELYGPRFVKFMANEVLIDMSSMMDEKANLSFLTPNSRSSSFNEVNL